MSQAVEERRLQVLDEGVQPLVAAARGAGFSGDICPSFKTLQRAAVAGRLEALKVAGRWVTSCAAIRRWIQATN